MAQTALLALVLMGSNAPQAEEDVKNRQIDPVTAAPILEARLRLFADPSPAPNLGYTGLWRQVFGNRPEQDADGSAVGWPERAGNSAPTTNLARRTPKIRTADWLSVAHRFYDIPPSDSTGMSIGDTSSGTAPAVGSAASAPATRFSGGVVTAAAVTQAGYVPASIESLKKPTDENGGSSFLITILVSIVATVLLLVIVFMPR